MELYAWYPYATIMAIMTSAACGVGVGQAIASTGAHEAIDRQPHARDEITRIALVGLALLETSAVLAVAMALWLFFTIDITTLTYYSAVSYLGIACALGLPCCALGIMGGFPAKQACFSVARQPFFAASIQNLLLLTLSMAQTPVLFGFIFAFLIKNSTANVQCLTQSIQLIAAGLAIGMGGIGPAIGLTRFAAAVCTSIGFNKHILPQLRLFALVSQAFIETPLIFALIIAWIVLARTVTPESNSYTGIILLSASICTALGTLGSSINSSRIASTAAREIAHAPALAAQLSRLSIFGQVFTDTCALYPLFVSLLLILTSPR